MRTRKKKIRVVLSLLLACSGCAHGHTRHVDQHASAASEDWGAGNGFLGSILQGVSNASAHGWRYAD